MDGKDSSWISPTEKFQWSPPTRYRVSELRKKFEKSPRKKSQAQEERQIYDQIQNQDEILYQEDSHNQEESPNQEEIRWQRDIDYDQNKFDPNERYSNQDAYHQSYRDEFQEPSFSNVPESEPRGYREGWSHTGQVESPFNKPVHAAVPSPSVRKPNRVWPRNERHDPHIPRVTAVIYSSDEEEYSKEELDRLEDENRKQMMRFLLAKDDISTFPEWIQRISRPKKKKRLYTTPVISDTDSDDYPSEEDSESQDKPVLGSSPRQASHNYGAGNAVEVQTVQPAITASTQRRPDIDYWGSIIDQQTKKSTKPKPYVEHALDRGLVAPGLRFVIRFACPWAKTGY